MLQCLCALGKDVRLKGFELAVRGIFAGVIGGLEEAKKGLVDNAMEINEYHQVNVKEEGFVSEVCIVGGILDAIYRTPRV